MRSAFGLHDARHGRMQLNDWIPGWVRHRLRRRYCALEFAKYTSGPISAIMLDRARGSMWGAEGNFGEDYGIAW